LIGARILLDRSARFLRAGGCFLHMVRRHRGGYGNLPRSAAVVAAARRPPPIPPGTMPRPAAANPQPACPVLREGRLLEHYHAEARKARHDAWPGAGHITSDGATASEGPAGLSRMQFPRLNQ